MSERRFGGYLVGEDRPTSQLMAAPRDASWFNHPGIGKGGKRHIVAPDGGSACRGQPLCLDIACSAASVEVILRCRRNGCAGCWPEGNGTS